MKLISAGTWIDQGTGHYKIKAIFDNGEVIDIDIDESFVLQESFREWNKLKWQDKVKYVLNKFSKRELVCQI